MGLLDDIIRDDARFAFMDTDVFGELVTYIKPDGTERSIRAVVARNLAPDMDAAGVLRFAILVSVENDSARGIAVSELNAKADRIRVAYLHGDTPQVVQLGSPESSDAGSLTFRVYMRSK